MFEAASALDKILEIMKEQELSAMQSTMFEAASALDKVVLETTIREQEERLRKESLARLEPERPVSEEIVVTRATRARPEPERPADQCCRPQCVLS